ncbi:MAG: hypothetical protein R3185_02240 [Candidatus Thermoplasmatota archaeon]|nr:hypothetical protein [Candidatus Thermoplasmatota archaeon]
MALTVLLLLLMGASTLTSVGLAQNEGPSHLGINVVEAEDLGCSDDTLAGQADLRVTVWVESVQVLQTPKAQDQDTPHYAALTVVEDVDPDAQIRVLVEEAEPGGFFGTGTDWESCDTGPEAGDAHVLTWDGTERTHRFQGESERAARVTLVLGPEPPALPQADVLAVEDHRANVAWDGAPDPGEASHRVRLHPVGTFLAEGPGGPGSTWLDGLCDNTAYRTYVEREHGRWHVQSQPVSFTTTNAPPAAPWIRGADLLEGNMTVRFETPTVHDLERLTFHARTANGTRHVLGEQPGMVVGPQPVRITFPEVPAGITHVTLEALDTGGLTATSPAFPVNGTDPGTGLPTEGEALPCWVTRKGPSTGSTQHGTTGEPAGSPSPGNQPPTGEGPNEPAPTPTSPSPGDTVGPEPAGAGLPWVPILVGVLVGAFLVGGLLALTGLLRR